MIRKLILPALALAMLGGCVTSGYQYRGGYGDYYYGQPQVEYRDYGYGSPYGGYGYGPGGLRGSFEYGYGGGYGYGSPYGYGGYYDPYRYYYPRRPPVVIVQPPPGGNDGEEHDAGERAEHCTTPPCGPLRLRSGRDQVIAQPAPWRGLGAGERSGGGGRSGDSPVMQPQRPPADMPRAGSSPPRSEPRRSGESAGQRRSEPDRDLRRKHEP